MAILQAVKEGIASLSTCSREVYAILVLQVLESFNYFSLSITLADYLTANFGASDVEAGSLYGAWGAALVGAGMAMGPIIDTVGVRRSLLLSASVTAASRAALAVVTSRRIAIFILLVPLSLGGALGSPVLTIGVKRAAPERARGFVFSLFYAAMNAAAFCAGLFRDWFVVGVKFLGVKPAGLRAYVAFGALVAVVEVVVVLFSIHGRPPPGEGGGEGVPVAVAATNPRPLEDSGSGSGGGDDGSVSPAPQPGARRLSSMDGVGLLLDGPPPATTAPSRFRFPSNLFTAVRASLAAIAGPETVKFLIVSVLATNLKNVFRFLDAALPKSLVRTRGCDAPAGLIYAINPALIMLLVPLVGAATTHIAPFDLITSGGFVSALSPLSIVAFPTSLAAVAAFVAMLSVGEAVWSPPWYTYSMQVAPDGHEGLFTAASSAPLFGAKILTGALSGWLLTRYCPGNGPCPGPGDPGPVPAPGACDPRSLWGVISAITLTSPVAILIFQRWLRPAERNEGGGGGYARVEAGSGDGGAGGDAGGGGVPRQLAVQPL